MRNVLSANFLRLKHSRILWLCLAYMLYDGLRLFYSASQAAAGTGARTAKGESAARWRRARPARRSIWPT